MGLADKLAAIAANTATEVAALEATPLPWPYSVAFREGRYVREGEDFQRIRALPRRNAWEGVEALVEAESARYRLPGSRARLFPAQAVALREAREARGLLGAIGVGSGKTLLALLLPEALGIDAERTVVLVPPALLKQAQSDFRGYARDWKVKTPVFLSYGILAHPSGATELERLRPRLVVADEAHALRRPESARTGRFFRYFEAHPETLLCALSGTIVIGSIRDYALLCGIALREGSPLPLRASELGPWAGALDPVSDPTRAWAPGALLQWAPGASTPDAWREGYRERLVSTPGVVATPFGNACEAAIYLASWDVGKCKKVDSALCQVRASGVLPTGEALEEPLSTARALKQLALGFYYRYEWGGPDNLPTDEQSMWLLARNDWAKLCRQWLEANAREGLDSPALLARAIERGEVEGAVAEARARWLTWEGFPEPPRRTVWVDRSRIERAAEWAVASRERSIVWYHSGAVAEALGAREGLLHVPPGEPITEAHARDARPLLLSIRSHGVGKNLQFASRSLVLEPPASGAAWEQLLARTHRPGQRADVVTWEVFLATEELKNAFNRALSEAGYLQATTGQPQKLNLAKKTF